MKKTIEDYVSKAKFFYVKTLTNHVLSMLESLEDDDKKIIIEQIIYKVRDKSIEEFKKELINMLDDFSVSKTKSRLYNNIHSLRKRSLDNFKKIQDEIHLAKIEKKKNESKSSFHDIVTNPKSYSDISDLKPGPNGSDIYDEIKPYIDNVKKADVFITNSFDGYGISSDTTLDKSRINFLDGCTSDYSVFSRVK